MPILYHIVVSACFHRIHIRFNRNLPHLPYIKKISFLIGLGLKTRQANDQNYVHEQTVAIIGLSLEPLWLKESLSYTTFSHCKGITRKRPSSIWTNLGNTSGQHCSHWSQLPPCWALGELCYLDTVIYGVHENCQAISWLIWRATPFT